MEGRYKSMAKIGGGQELVKNLYVPSACGVTIVELVFPVLYLRSTMMLVVESRWFNRVIECLCSL